MSFIQSFDFKNSRKRNRPGRGGGVPPAKGARQRFVPAGGNFTALNYHTCFLDSCKAQPSDFYRKFLPLAGFFVGEPSPIGNSYAVKAGGMSYSTPLP
jgi:hypothetical protein